MEMFELKEAGHMTAMEKMSKLMADASTMQDWLEKKREEFEGLPNEA